MVTAVGYSVLIRGFRLALSVEGLKPHTIRSYVRDVERFARHHGQDPLSVTSSDIRSSFTHNCRPPDPLRSASLAPFKQGEKLRAAEKGKVAGDILQIAMLDEFPYGTWEQLVPVDLSRPERVPK